MVLTERSVVEQRYEAVQQVLRDGVPVTEVAARFGVSRQSVHAWIRRYQADGVAALMDRSHRPKGCPHQTVAEVEAAVCELRRQHPGWGPTRLRHELERRRVAPVPSRSAVYRILVRSGLLEPRSRRRGKGDYRRWERDTPMQLWQIDVMGEVLLADGTELKVVTGVDDHSRFCVLAAVVRRATARAVCAAFAEAMRRHGVPEEVLTDNGKQFTGRFNKPRPAEVLFERILRENGIAQRLTKPRSPTTTGKIERFHRTLREELLADQSPFPTLEAAQAAVDRWVADYNADRPHQSLGMATPAQRFTAERPAAAQTMPLRTPVELTPPASPAAVELEVQVPPSGNMWVGGRQVWLGPRLAGATVTLWVDRTSMHLSLDGVLLKTLPSRCTAADLTRLRHRPGARPAGPPPRSAAVQATTLTDSDAVEVDRLVNAAGLVGLDNRQLVVGSQLAGRRVTLRLEATVLHVLADGFLVRTLPSPVTPARRARLQGARLAPGDLPAPSGPAVVQRRVSSRGGIQVARQKLQVGLPHAGKVVTVVIDRTCFQVLHDGAPLKVFPRAVHEEVTRHKAYEHKTGN